MVFVHGIYVLETMGWCLSMGYMYLRLWAGISPWVGHDSSLACPSVTISTNAYLFKINLFNCDCVPVFMRVYVYIAMYRFSHVFLFGLVFTFVVLHILGCVHLYLC